MAVLGWTSTDTLNTSPADIRTAIDARYEFVQDILKATFGSSDATADPPVSKRKLTAKLFDAIFGGGRK